MVIFWLGQNLSLVIEENILGDEPWVSGIHPYYWNVLGSDPDGGCLDDHPLEGGSLHRLATDGLMSCPFACDISRTRTKRLCSREWDGNR